MSSKAKKLLIVDGYNVLRSGSRYKTITDPDYTDDAFNAAREALINDVVSFAGREWNAVIVFDATNNEHSAGETEIIGGVRILFSPYQQSADKVIEELAHDARRRQVETLVVTSDASIQDAVFGGGIDRMSANDFSWEINTLGEERRRESEISVAQKNTLAARLSPEMRKKLEELRDQ
ncbi:MAG: NYN domain-containing protein [Raoultibacter sp.]|jgi:predicted RNA-binding protein with PIN domain